jgi:PTS system N-acetylglucosamine-specific IIC component
VVVGPTADQLAGDMRAAVALAPAATAAAESNTQREPGEALAAALGGRDNVLELVLAKGRLLLRLRDPAAIEDGRLQALGVRATARTAADGVHLLHPEPGSLLAD